MSTVNYPLIFTYRDVLLGAGFAAIVEMRGRALMAAEDDGDFWIYGITPSGMGRGGGSGEEAAAAFRENYCTVLLDILEDAKTFSEFNSILDSVFHDARPAMMQKWNQALKKVRKGEISLDWLKSVPSDSHAFGLTVVELELHPPKVLTQSSTHEPRAWLGQAA